MTTFMARPKKTTAKAKKTAAKKAVKAKAKKPTVKAKKTTARKKESTHIIAILDRSGSMRPVVNDAIGGYNNFISEQKKLKDKATLSGTLFDDRFEPLYEGKSIDIQDVPELTTATFVPRGMTALYDAIGKSVTGYKATMQNVKESQRPTKVLCIIVTDGGENSSTEFKQTDIADLIAYQKKNNWQFLFLCSTEDAVTVSKGLNISQGNTFQFQNTSLGNQVLYSKVSRAAASYRGMSASLASVNSESLLSDEDEN